MKNALQAQGSRTVFEKLREAALAYQLERHWDKDKILTEYLNTIYFGEGAYGIEAAAKTYFGWNHPGCGTPGHRCASELLPWEAATLSGIISSPTGYDPKTRPQAALVRRNLVLQNMEEQGYITQGEYRRYSRVPLPPPGQIHAPSQAVLGALLHVVAAATARRPVRRGSGVQRRPQGQVHARPQPREQGAGDRRPERRRPRPLIRGRGGRQQDRRHPGARRRHRLQAQPFNIATEGARQPGSSFKPFTLVTALEQGISPIERLGLGAAGAAVQGRAPKENGKTKIVNDLFRVSNYGDEYAGSRTLQDATTFSDNSVYSQVGMQVGPANVAATAQKMGITSPLTTPGIKYSVTAGRSRSTTRR